MRPPRAVGATDVSWAAAGAPRSAHRSPNAAARILRIDRESRLPWAASAMGLLRRAPRAGLFLRRSLLKHHVSRRISAARPWTPVNRRVPPPTELGRKPAWTSPTLLSATLAYDYPVRR